MSLTHKRSALALACGLALAGAGVAEAAAADMDMQQRWRDYARQRIAPAYSWSGIAPAAAPDVLGAWRESADAPRRQVARLAGELLGATRLQVSSSVQRQPVANASALGVLGDSRSPITGEFVASSIDRTVGSSGRFSVSAILARQRYASARLGLVPWEAPMHLDPVLGGLPQESSSGGGVRMAYSEPLNDRLSVSVALQSKLDMEPFKSYRGVYSDPGDFDVPARAELGVGFALTDDVQLSVGAERVFYSDIDAFTSAALPSRFLSLLGDGTSPVFAWQDLTVYTAEAAVRDGTGGEWSLRYTTRQQPSPTSRLLLRALEPEFTNTNIGLGYRRDLRDFGALWFAASYAPSQYFLGASPYVQRELDGGSQVEVEALWSIPF